MTIKTIKIYGYDVRYESSPKIHKEVFNRLIDWYVKHEAFFGESICQRDSTLISAPDVLADIADDIIKFETVEYEMIDEEEQNV